MIGLATISPLTTVGLCLIECMPSTADCGKLIMGVPIIEPNTPPFDKSNDNEKVIRNIANDSSSPKKFISTASIAPTSTTSPASPLAATNFLTDDNDQTNIVIEKQQVQQPVQQQQVEKKCETKSLNSSFSHIPLIPIKSSTGSKTSSRTSNDNNNSIRNKNHHHHRRTQSSGAILSAESFNMKRATISSVSRSHWELDFDQLSFGEELGKGAYGVVHQGTLWGTDVAIKRLNTNGFSFDDEDNKKTDERTINLRKKLLSDLTNEVKILSELRHPNVVLYIGVCAKIPNVCIVTELCPRRSLFDIIHDPSVALSCELRLRMALQTAQGMAYLHNQHNRIIHRDLKSHNLLVCENFDIKVADFGLTVVRQNATKNNHKSTDTNSSDPTIDSRIDSIGDNDDIQSVSSMGGHYGVHGTPQWMAPEVMEGSPYNGKVDVYSYGIVLCELFSRVLPFSDRYRAFEFIEAVLEQGATPTIPRWCHSASTKKKQPPR